MASDVDASGIRVGRSRRMVAVGAIALLAGVVTSCQPVKLGAKCRTNELKHDGGSWIMKCHKGRWTRALTKADAARLLAQLTPSITVPTTTEATVPPVTAAAPPTVPPTAAPTVPSTTVPVALTDLDPAFGTNGSRLHQVAVPGYNVGSITTIRSTTAGLYVVWQTPQPGFGSSSMLVARFTPAGALDTAFSGDGLLHIPNVLSVTADASGRVYAVGNGTIDTTVLRYTATGDPDAAIGAGGAITYNDSPNSCGGFATVTALSDGSALVWRNSPACPIRRFLPDGTSSVWGDVSALGAATIGTVTAGPTGSAYLRTGASSSFGSGVVGVLKLTSTGAPDAGFGTNGLVDLGAIAGTSYPTTMVVLSDGSMLFGNPSGMSFPGASVLLKRVLTNGTADTGGGFGSSGLVADGHAVTPLPAGGFFVTSWATSTQATHRAFTAVGQPSAAFQGVSGAGRLDFESQAGYFSETVVLGGRLMTVIDRSSGSVELLKFRQTA